MCTNSSNLSGNSNVSSHVNIKASKKNPLEGNNYYERYLVKGKKNLTDFKVKVELKGQFWGRLGGSEVEHLPSAQGVILGS